MRLGLDVGGTKTDAVAVADDGAIVARVRAATAWGPEGVTRTVLEAVERLAVEGALDRGGIRSVGVGMPGQVEPGTGRVVHAVNLGVDLLDLPAALAPLLGMPVWVENDVKAAALGAFTLRGGSGSMAYLNLGTGVAAGIVTGGDVWRGGRGTAGEVGHISIDPRGPVCRCGQRGCIEALSGGGAVAQRWAASGAEAGAHPVADVFDAADAGDPRARMLRAGVAQGVAAAVRVLVLAADVDVVVVGGGLTALGARLLRDVELELTASAAASPFMRSLRLDERVEVLPPGSPAAALGAALVGAAHEAAHDREPDPAHDPEQDTEQDPEEAFARG